MAQAKRSGKPVEATAAATPTSTMTANPDGTVAVHQSAAPTRKRVGKAWKPLDATLVRHGDGRITPVTSLHEITLSGGGTGPMATMVSGDRSLELSLPFPLPKPSLTGATATYPNVLSGVDLQVTVNREGGFSHVLVVRDATAATHPALSQLTLTTKAQGFTLGTDKAGNITGRDRAGKEVLFAPAATMWDSASGTAASAAQGTASTAKAPGSRAKVARIGTNLRAGRIDLTPDRSMLTSPATTYPVFIDPTFNWASAGAAKSGWSTISRDHPASNFWKKTPDPDGRMQVGNSGSQWSHTLVNFPVPTGTLAGAVINSATFKITNTYSYSCTAKKVNLYAPAATLTSSNATWNHWKNVSYGSIVDQKEFAYGYSNSCKAAAASFDVTPEIRNNVTAGKSSQTLILTADNEANDVWGWKKFLETSPTLTILYNHKPNKPAGLTTSPQTSCTAATPTTVGDGPVSLYAPASDRNGGVLGVSFKLWKTADSTETPIASSNPNLLTYSSGSTAVLVIPAATLLAAAGGSVTGFSWKVQTTDFNMTSDWSDTCRFDYDPTRAGPPVVTPPAEQTTIGQGATFTIAPPSGSIPAGYSYQLNDSAPLTVTATSGNASVTVTPTRFTNTLTVTSLSAGGNFGETASVTFNSAPSAVAADADMNGDGTADLVTTGGINGLPSGLWLGAGKSGASVNTNITNIGANGNGVAGSKSPSDFNSAKAITGRFTGTGLQDVLIYYPAGADQGSTGILRANGDGSVIQAQLNDNRFGIDPALLTDEDGNWPLQLANAGDSRGLGSPFPDLIGTSGDAAAGYHLTYYLNGGWPAGYVEVIRTTAITPTGGTDWDSWTISTAQLTSGTSMFLWHRATGALHLWTNLAFNTETGQLTYTPYALSTNWNAGATHSLRAADINNDGTADLWTIGAGAHSGAWLVTNLTAGTGTISAQASQALITSNYTWPMNDGSSGTVTTATETTSGKTLTATGNAVWRTGDLFSPSILLNTDATGTNIDHSGTGHLTSNEALIDTTKSFSISVWVKPTGQGGVIVSEDGAHSSRFILWNNEVDNTWRFGMAAGDANTWVYTQAVTPAGTALGVWTHLIATYNAGNRTLALYVNGSLKATAQYTNTPTWPATGKFVVGRFLYLGAPAAYYSGQISNLQVWNTALTPSQVNASNTQPSGSLVPFGATKWTPPGTTQKVVEIYAADPTGNLWRYPKNGNTVGEPRLMATGWNQFTTVGIADWDHDGYQDVLVRDNTTCKLQVFLGTADDLSPQPTELGIGWCNHTIFGVGDWNQDGHQDVITVDKANSNMYYYPGDLTGGTGARVFMGNGWGTGYSPYGLADVNSDGIPDIVTRMSTTDTLRLYDFPGSTGRQIGTGWNGYTFFGIADFDDDNELELIVRHDATGILWRYGDMWDQSPEAVREMISGGW
ncbi:hypothetical protein GCM10027280_43050 [Micromonospora polyrhachis]|uniref:Cyclic nucleotide-binding domain-containing protein n=1 Tax=Micromonospora polyrhachis TaxID=1282883 RepID=A0A7W7SX07_9ACTN|nr:LamG-like jellyroll fold domain-containing protein [Micromonospora polyrhachis]MBB4962126.1 hypothetical protein [Micromonospora polyrhachis]